MFNFFKKRDYKEELIELLKKVTCHLQHSDESVWSDLSPEEVIKKLNTKIERLSTGKSIVKNELIGLFLPTSSIQEISMENNWSNEYISLSEKFDELIIRI